MAVSPKMEHVSTNAHHCFHINALSNLHYFMSFIAKNEKAFTLTLFKDLEALEDNLRVMAFSTKNVNVALC